MQATYQSRFHQRWDALRDDHVRALAWLIDAPDLLDSKAPQWESRIASLGDLPACDIDAWLFDLDREPSPLHARLQLSPFTRLGRYAETLMAFYLDHLGILAAHGVPVREGKDRTVGEFDFLLHTETGLLHWEFATKLYLLEASGKGQHVDYFVGPNLIDSLGAKIQKILQQQLRLAEHPAAQPLLPAPVVGAHALVKGWLFYHEDEDPHRTSALGVSFDHCRGFWRTCSEVASLTSSAYAILPRLQWLAPAKLQLSHTLSKPELKSRLDLHFEKDSMPVLVACLTTDGDTAREVERGFIVPNDWRVRAGLRARRVIE